jgi:hypothetical protein
VPSGGTLFGLLGTFIAVYRTLNPCSTWFGKELTVSAGTMWMIFWAGAGSFLPLLFLQYVGEEGVYSIIAQEMSAKNSSSSRRSTVSTMEGRVCIPGSFCFQPRFWGNSTS